MSDAPERVTADHAMRMLGYLATSARVYGGSDVSHIQTTRENVIATYITETEAEVARLRDVIRAYGDTPDYAVSRFKQIDLLKDQRAHDRLKIDELQRKNARLREALRELRRMVIYGYVDESVMDEADKLLEADDE